MKEVIETLFREYRILLAEKMILWTMFVMPAGTRQSYFFATVAKAYAEFFYEEYKTETAPTQQASR